MIEKSPKKIDMIEKTAELPPTTIEKCANSQGMLQDVHADVYSVLQCPHVQALSGLIDVSGG